VIRPGTPGLGPRQLAATRIALALCLARERHDAEGFRCLEACLPRAVLIGALIGAIRALARDVAASRGLTPACLYRELIDDILAREASL
jgi:hypothetical protein